MGDIASVLLSLVLLALVIAVYFLPTIVAVRTKHRSTTALFLLNLFLGWTIAGWVLALVWAFMKPPKVEVVTQPSAGDELLKLAELKERGILSEQEFEDRKYKILNAERSG